LAGVDAKELVKRSPPIIAEKKKNGLIKVKFGKDSYTIREKDWEDFVKAFWEGKAQDFLEDRDVILKAMRESYAFRKLMEEIYGPDIALRLRKEWEKGRPREVIGPNE